MLPDVEQTNHFLTLTGGEFLSGVSRISILDWYSYLINQYQYVFTWVALYYLYSLLCMANLLLSTLFPYPRTVLDQNKQPFSSASHFILTMSSREEQEQQWHSPHHFNDSMLKHFLSCRQFQWSNNPQIIPFLLTHPVSSLRWGDVSFAHFNVVPTTPTG